MKKYSNKKSISGAGVLVAALLASPLQAQDNGGNLASDAVEGAKELASEAGDMVKGALNGWSGTASLGATNASGNSKANNINASIRLAKTHNRWEHLLFGSMFKGKSTIVIETRDELGNTVDANDDGVPDREIVEGDNSDRIALGYQPKYYFSDKTYAFGLLDWETDKPANIDAATRQVIGIGHRFYRNEQGFFSGEIGIGNKMTEQVYGDDIDGGIGYLGLNFLHRFNDNAAFNADLRSDFGSDNTFVEIGLGLAFKVSEGMAFKVSHFSRSNSDITADYSPLDSGSDNVTTMALVLDI